MSISEQVKELRKATKWFDAACFPEGVKLANKAADTIESLSAKLQAANMERSAEDCGGWIQCSERLPENEKMVLLSLKNLDICTGFNADFEKRFHIVGYGYTNYENVLAWMPLPEPYHEP